MDKESIKENIWKPLQGYNDKYHISSFGEIRNQHNRMLKSRINRDGYYQISLVENGIKKSKLVHRLVGVTFVNNPDLLPLINHKDENKLNNYFDNLEWCTVEYNNNYGERNSKLSCTMKKSTHWYKNLNAPQKIMQICKETGNIIAKFNSMQDASKSSGITVKTISRTVNKIYNKSRCKFDWKYEN